MSRSKGIYYFFKTPQRRQKYILKDEEDMYNTDISISGNKITLNNLPLCPSANNLQRTNYHTRSRYNSKPYMEFLKESEEWREKNHDQLMKARQILNGEMLASHDKVLNLELVFYLNDIYTKKLTVRRRDYHNFLKGMTDMVSKSLAFDDCMIFRHTSMQIPSDNVRVKAIISSAVSEPVYLKKSVS